MSTNRTSIGLRVSELSDHGLADSQAGPSYPVSPAAALRLMASTRQAVQYYTPRHDIEAERSIIAAILADNRALETVQEFLEPEHFFEPLHQLMFESARRLIRVGSMASPMTLFSLFDGVEPIDRNLTAGQYLIELASTPGDVRQVGRLGRHILDLAVRRQLELIGNDLIYAAHDSVATCQTIEEITERLDLLRGLSAASAELGSSVATPSRACDV